MLQVGALLPGDYDLVPSRYEKDPQSETASFMLEAWASGSGGLSWNQVESAAVDDDKKEKVDCSYRYTDPDEFTMRFFSGAIRMSKNGPS